MPLHSGQRDPNTGSDEQQAKAIRLVENRRRRLTNGFQGPARVPARAHARHNENRQSCVRWLRRNSSASTVIYEIRDINSRLTCGYLGRSHEAELPVLAFERVFTSHHERFFFWYFSEV